MTFSRRHEQCRSQSAFTLIELLVVIAIIAILSVVVILTLNPAELLRQSRDANRLSDLDTLNHALSLYSTDQSASALFSMGSASTTYVSIPDPVATSTAGDQCQGLNLPALSTTSGYSYHCAASSTFRATNGTGWIPVNFTTISSGSPLGNLPVDAVNASSSNLFYTYTTDGTKYLLTAIFESQKYKLQLASNPPIQGYPEVAAVGSNLAISELYNPTGLVGYWPFTEGSGSSTQDQSGNGNNGTWNGTASGNSGYYTTVTKIGAYAGYFNGTNNYVNVGSSIASTFSGSNFWTISGWGYYSGNPGLYPAILSAAGGSGAWLGLNVSTARPEISYNGTDLCVAPTTLSTGWHFLTGARSSSTWMIYVDGVLANTCSNATTLTYSGATYIGDNAYVTGSYWNQGSIDDVRVYNRTLSPAEIQAMYNAQR